MFARATELGAPQAQAPRRRARDRRLHGRAPQGGARRARARRRRGRRPRQLPPPPRAAAPPRRGAATTAARTLGDRRRARQGRDLRGPVGRGRRRRRLGLRHDPARLRQVLHVLRGAVHARARARHAAARGPAPGPRARRRRLPGGRAAGPDRQLVRAGTTTSFAELLRAVAPRRRDRAGPLHLALPGRLHRRRDRRRSPRSRRSASTSTCRCSRAPTPCSSACAAATPSPTTARSSHALRAAMPEIAMSTDILAGFSGETEDDHAADARADARAAVRLARSCSPTPSAT